MGQAISLILRQRIQHLRSEGTTLAQISEDLGLRYGTVKHLCRRLRTLGQAGLLPGYSSCGRKARAKPALQKEQALQQRAAHPRWGAPRIHVELQRAGVDPPCVRTLQKWFRQAGAYTPRRQGAEPAIGRAIAVHNIWEVDAKEHLVLADGAPGCYLTIGDEKSGGWLEAALFPL